MQTYFVSDGARVKIGRTNDPNWRRSTLQVGHPEQLSIILLLEGDHEKLLHRQFSKFHIRGEWFWLSKGIERYVASHNPRYAQDRSFLAFIVRQIDRDDAIGWTAREVLKDPYYPRQSSTLHFLLRYFDRLSTPDAMKLRKGIKKLHGEWRDDLRFAGERVFNQPTPRLVKKVVQ